MRIRSVEPTPSPHNMKINLDTRLPDGVKFNFNRENRERAPDYIRRLLDIEGVKGIFQVADFISIERDPKADWKAILSEVRKRFETEAPGSLNGEPYAGPVPEAGYGEVQVLVQEFRGIPTQVKLLFGNEEKRFGLPERFARAVMEIQKVTPNYILERKWVDKGVRYGELDEIGETVVKELDAAYDQERLNLLLEQALAQGRTETGAPPVEEKPTAEEIGKMLDDPDWRVRYAAFEKLNPTPADLPIVVKALKDPNQSIRRLATVYLGMIGGKEVLPYLVQALKDKSVAVRRTAGDTLSDLGDPDAIPAMMEALKDPSRLVRWRAARFLYEVGDESALAALREAENDPEFEVSLQVKMAIARIEGGEEAAGPVWQQMMRARESQ